MKNDHHPSAHKIFEYLDGELSAKALQGFEAHTKICPDCQARIEDTRALFSAIESLPDVSTPASITRAVIRTLIKKTKRYSASLSLFSIPLIASIAALAILAAVIPLEPLNDWILLAYAHTMDILSIPMLEFQAAFQSSIDWISEFEPQFSVQHVQFSADFLTSAQSIVILVSSSLLWYFSNKRMLPGPPYSLGRNGGIS